MLWFWQLQISKHQPGNTASHRASLSKPAMVASEWHQAPQATPQQSYPSLSTVPEKSSPETVDEAITAEGDGSVSPKHCIYIPNTCT